VSVELLLWVQNAKVHSFGQWAAVNRAMPLSNSVVIDLSRGVRLCNITLCAFRLRMQLKNVAGSIVCQSDHFSCGAAQPCIPWSWRCDGHIDCSNGHDESPETCKC